THEHQDQPQRLRLAGRMDPAHHVREAEQSEGAETAQERARREQDGGDHVQQHGHRMPSRFSIRWATVTEPMKASRARTTSSGTMVPSSRATEPTAVAAMVRVTRTSSARIRSRASGPRTRRTSVSTADTAITVRVMPYSRLMIPFLG